MKLTDFFSNKKFDYTKSETLSSSVGEKQENQFRKYFDRTYDSVQKEIDKAIKEYFESQKQGADNV